MGCGKGAVGLQAEAPQQGAGCSMAAEWALITFEMRSVTYSYLVSTIYGPYLRCKSIAIFVDEALVLPDVSKRGHPLHDCVNVLLMHAARKNVGSTALPTRVLTIKTHLAASK